MQSRFAMGRCCCTPLSPEIPAWFGQWGNSDTPPTNLIYPQDFLATFHHHWWEGNTSSRLYRTNGIALFQGLNVPNGATITLASLNLQGGGSVISGLGNTFRVWTAISCYDVDSAPLVNPWANNADCLAAPRTAESSLRTLYTGDGTDFGVGDSVLTYNVTTSVIAQVQAIVNRPGWSSGGNIMFFLRTVVTTSSFNFIQAYLTHHNSYYGAGVSTLTVEYS